MSRSCKVSVVIPSFNHREFLPEAVESVTALQRDHLELTTAPPMSEHAKKWIRCPNGGINTIRQENKGLAARNAGVAMAKVSIAVPNYKQPSYLRQRIGSVLGQTYQDFELILLDDRSTDTG